MKQVTYLSFFIFSFAIAAPPSLDGYHQLRYKPRHRYSDQDHLNLGVPRDYRGPTNRAGFEDSEYWYNEGQLDLQSQLNKVQNINKAKNIIFFLGDGTSLSTMTAIRLAKGKATTNYEHEVLSWEQFPNTGIIKTYNTNYLTTDSAASSTAYLTGSKANQGTVGVDINVALGDCAASKNEAFLTTSVLRDFQVDGRATGIVTTTRVTHASPAGNYAHSAERHWESDKDMLDEGADPTECDDIAKQLVFGTTGSDINVILGGGRRNFIPNTITDDEGDTGDREDGLDLISSWLSVQGTKGTATYVYNAAELRGTDGANTDYLLGLFSSSHMEYQVDIQPEDEDPTLPEMVEKAIEVLQNKTNGFFLFVEGGLIDKAHHINEATAAMEEGKHFELAVEKALSMVSTDETLVIVTADHAQPLSLNGYQLRSADVSGLSDTPSDVDGYKIHTMMYGSGPGFRDQKDNLRPDPETEDWSDPDHDYPATVPTVESYHSPEDVALFAIGPWSHLFTGIHENSYIPQVLRYAACVGNGLHSCDL